MKSKRILTMILAALTAGTMLVSCSSGESGTSSTASTGSSSTAEGGSSAAETDSNFNKTGLPIVNEQITLEAIAVSSDESKPVNESLLYQQLEEKTNVKIEFNDINKDMWPEKKGILFSSGDLPDFIFGDWALGTADLLKYGEQGLIIDLKGLMEEYNPYMKAKLDSTDGTWQAITTADGKIYGYPGLDISPMQVSNPFFINQEWLDAVGMEVPTTTDEFYEVLKAFKTQDPNGNGEADEIPYSFTGNCSDLFGAFGRLDSFNSRHIVLEDDGTKVVYSAATDEYKAAIEYFHKLFSEGLIDIEAFSQDGSIFNGKVKGETRLVGVLQGWRDTAWQRTPEDADYVVLPPLTGPNGDCLFPSRYVTNHGVSSTGSLVITNVCEYPEIVARWADEWYEPDFSYQESLQQLEGVHIEFQDDGMIQSIAVRDDFDVNANTFPQARIHNMALTDHERAITPAAHIARKVEIDQEYLHALRDKDFFPSMMMTLEESDRLAQLNVDLNGYANECYARWITEGGVENEWDNYLAELNKMGLEEYISIYQGALDRYNGQ